MFKVTEAPKDTRRGITMADMKPLDIGVIVSGDDEYMGQIVMRTASTARFEVMRLSNPKPNRCWTYGATVRVRLLCPGDEVTLTVT